MTAPIITSTNSHLLIYVTDADKQQAMNVFLGVYVPIEGMCNIWDMTTDYYLHHTSTCNLKALKKRKR